VSALSLLEFYVKSTPWPCPQGNVDLLAGPTSWSVDIIPVQNVESFIARATSQIVPPSDFGC